MIDLSLLEEKARHALPRSLWEYFAGGADSEQTLVDNEEAWKRFRLVPRVMRDVGDVITDVEILGSKLRLPVIAGPWSFQGLAHTDGECATATGAGAVGSLFVAPVIATRSLEETGPANTGIPAWFQYYMLKDRGRTAALIEQAKEAEYSALVLTVDKLPIAGKRRRKAASWLTLDKGMRIPNFNYETETDEVGPDEYFANILDHAPSFDDITYAREVTGLPVIVKGILDPHDALRAVDFGASGVVVSNHGGRQLDGAISTADALPAVVAAVEGRVPVLVDGGIRSGADVMKALSIGASAVLVTRPIIWGLALDGADGVTAVLNELHDELVHTMALSGTPTVDEIDRARVRSI
ncbi:alpha-hydroxy-acid oxidizing protein [bacterium]|nr:alpha-hydroxy-acid oxidizing protein [bacterium]